MKLRFVILVILLRTLVSSFALKNINCRDFFTAMCENKDMSPSRSSRNISWICRGRFGKLDLNCSGIETDNTTLRAVRPCCEATIKDGDRTETYQKVCGYGRFSSNCAFGVFATSAMTCYELYKHKDIDILNCIEDAMSCTNCGQKASSIDSYRKWECHWSSMRLRIFHNGGVLLYTQCNGTDDPLAKPVCFDGFHQTNGNRQETRLTSQGEPQDMNCLKRKVMDEKHQSSITWNCTSEFTHISLTCKESGTGIAVKGTTNMCCEVVIQKANHTPTKEPDSAVMRQTHAALCKVISTAVNNTKVWDCELELAYLRIFAARDGKYCPGCKTQNDKTDLQNCTVHGENNAPTTQPSTPGNSFSTMVMPTTKVAPATKKVSTTPLPAGNTNLAQTTPSKQRTTSAGRHSTTTPGSHSTTTPGSYSATTTGSYSATTPGRHRKTKPGSHSTTTPRDHSTTTPGRDSSIISERQSTVTPGGHSSVKPGSYNLTISTKPSTALPTINKEQHSVTPTVTGTKVTDARNGAPLKNETVKALGKTLIENVSQFHCTDFSVKKLLLNIEDIVRPLLRHILNSSTSGAISFFHKIIELHAVVTTNLNKTITVPDPPRGAKQSQGSVSLSPGSIDIDHGRLGIVTVVFKFEAVCNGTQELKLDSSDTKSHSSLQAPIVSVLAMTAKGNINRLQDNATIRFGTKISNPSLTDCMFLDRSSRSNKPSWSKSGMTFVDGHDENYTTCLTDHFTSFAVLINHRGDPPYSRALDLITKIGSGIAIVSLLLCIFTFACVRSLSALRYRIHLNLCISLAGAQLIFVAGIEATDIKGVCVAVAIMLHYFFTASFAWMCAEAIHLFTKIVTVFDMQTIKMRYYFALGWGMPAVVVAISLIANYNGYSTSKLCWLSIEGGFIWAFIAPIIIIVSVNLAVLIAVIVVRVSLKSNPLAPSENKKFAAALKTVVILFPLLGLCWIFGLIGVMTRNRPFLYVFVVLSSFQGVFILLFHCFGNTEVRNSLKAIKERHSIQSSINNEQKNRAKETHRNEKAITSSESKGLLTKLSVSKNKRKQRRQATEV